MFSGWFWRPRSQARPSEGPDTFMRQFRKGVLSLSFPSILLCLRVFRRPRYHSSLCLCTSKTFHYLGEEVGRSTSTNRYRTDFYSQMLLYERQCASTPKRGVCAEYLKPCLFNQNFLACTINCHYGT